MMQSTAIGITGQRMYETDVLVIGGGIAGLRAAVEAVTHSVTVTIVANNKIGYACNSAISGGGFACAAGVKLPGIGLDSPEAFFEDTMAAGKGINDPVMVKTMVEGIPAQKDFLQSIGMALADPANNEWMRGLSGTGHRYPKLCYPAGLTGSEMTRILRKYARGLHVRFIEDVLITRLLVHGRAVTGALGIDKQGEPVVIAARTVILAAGGLGGIFSRNDNVSGATGDGYYLAYEAGASLRDMEFIQFDPLGDASGKHPFFFECLLQYPGIRLLNSETADVVKKHGLDSVAQLTRDRLARVITEELQGGLGVNGKLILDIGGLSADEITQLAHQLPAAARRGIVKFPVAPTCHFHMGGVTTDARCRTSLGCLYAAGEVCGGVHGANRLAGNALSEALVFGHIAGREAAETAVRMDMPEIPADMMSDYIDELNARYTIGAADTWTPVWCELKNLMWSSCGPSRHGTSLKNALSRIETIHQRLENIVVSDLSNLHAAIKMKSSATVGEMIVRASLHRCESRGAHFRRDHEHQDDDAWLCNISVYKGRRGMELSTTAIETNTTKI